MGKMKTTLLLLLLLLLQHSVQEKEATSGDHHKEEGEEEEDRPRSKFHCSDSISHRADLTQEIISPEWCPRENVRNQ